MIISKYEAKGKHVNSKCNIYDITRVKRIDTFKKYEKPTTHQINGENILSKRRYREKVTHKAVK